MCVSLGIGLFLHLYMDELKPMSNSEHENGKLSDVILYVAIIIWSPRWSSSNFKDKYLFSLLFFWLFLRKLSAISVESPYNKHCEPSPLSDLVPSLRLFLKYQSKTKSILSKFDSTILYHYDSYFCFLKVIFYEIGNLQPIGQIRKFLTAFLP